MPVTAWAHGVAAPGSGFGTTERRAVLLAQRLACRIRLRVRNSSFSALRSYLRSQCTKHTCAEGHVTGHTVKDLLRPSQRRTHWQSVSLAVLCGTGGMATAVRLEQRKGRVREGGWRYFRISSM
jgi:hypothetical protein